MSQGENMTFFEHFHYLVAPEMYSAVLLTAAGNQILQFTSTLSKSTELV